MKKINIPKIIGHRGAKGYAPENTLVSIHTAADMGVEWVQLDVKLTFDDVAVLFFDENLLRCANSDEKIERITLEEIKTKDVGSNFSETFVGEQIPTLEEAMEVIINRKLGLNLNINPCPSREIETAEVALDIIGRIYDPEDELPLISSLSHVTLETAKDSLPKFPRALMIDEYIENWAEIAEHLQVSAISFNADKATTEQINNYINYGKPTIAYVVNEPIKAMQLLDIGISSIVTDYPDLILEEIESFN